MDTQEHGSTDGPAEAGDPGAPTGGGSLMFWLLIGLAAIGFVPCIVLPIWRDYQALALAAQAEERLVAELRADVQRQKRTLEAIRTDPAAGVRLAQRELAYYRPGQLEVHVPGVPAVKATAVVQPLEPVEPPASVARLLGRLPAANYDRIFCRGPTRTVIMLLAGGLVVSAFVLYSPRPDTRRRGGQAD